MTPPFKITKIIVLKTNATDKVILFTDLPPAVWPFKEETCLQFEVAKDKGEQYVKDNFGLEASPANTDGASARSAIEFEIKDVSS